MIIKNDFPKGKWFHYKVNGVSKKIYISGNSQLYVEEIKHPEQVHFSSIEKGLNDICYNGKKFAKNIKMNKAYSDSTNNIISKPNLIINGNFIDTDISNYWSLGKATYRIYTNNSPVENTNYIGIKKAELFSTGEYRGQEISVESGKEYKLSGYIKGEVSSKSEKGIILVTNSETAETVVQYTYMGRGEWVNFTTTFTANCDTIRILLISKSDYMAETFFADLKLELLD